MGLFHFGWFLEWAATEEFFHTVFGVGITIYELYVCGEIVSKFGFAFL